MNAMGCDGVFSNLIDQASFIDKVVLSVRGKKRKRPQAAIETVQNLAIGGPGRFYGRALHFNCRDGGNPGELRYAPLTHFPSVPPLRLILRSVSTPLNSEQVTLTEISLVRFDFSSYVSAVELTSDVSGYEVGEIRRTLILGNRSIRDFSDAEGRETVYLGSPKSSLQLRLYQKTKTIVRLEFVLRLPFLRSNEIQHPADLLILSSASLWNKILPPCP